MIPHRYLNPSDNIAQYNADQIGRQEVTADWYINSDMAGETVFGWVGDEAASLGLDPWRINPDFDVSRDGEVIPAHMRLFIQRRDAERLGIELPPQMPVHWHERRHGVKI